LLNALRYPEALTQLEIVTRDKPDFAQGWLVLGSLQLQEKRAVPAEAAFKRYLSLAEKQPPSADRDRALAQAFLALAQIAEKRQAFAEAEAWLQRINSPDVLVQAQSRRAALLARQGQLQAGIALIRELPERRTDDARNKLFAEVALLKEFKQLPMAYERLGQAVAGAPQDMELIYEQAMTAEKLNQLADMERLLRRVIEIKPDYAAAYNALGYSLADRNMRLPEAKQLIQKALEFAPTDPFIRDSLGWVEFRLGNLQEAARILSDAYKDKPDPEIAAHLGEVLWSLQQRDRALAVWREGHMMNPDNETLQETLQRLLVKL
jgi:tetratricopeptide (TPR) repeat protein